MQDISILPGRIRLRNNKIYNNKSMARFLNCYLDNLYGVKNSKVNPDIATITIEYDTKKTSIDDLKASIEQLIDTGFNNRSKDFEDFSEYQELLIKRERSKRNFIIFAIIYIAFKIKQAYYGKFSLAGSVKVLKLASIITVIGGYPLFKKFYSKLTGKLPLDNDLLYYDLALSSTLLRESSKGVFVHVLKYLNEFKKYSADANNKSLLWQSMKEGRGLPWEKSDKPEEELEIYKNVDRYQNSITYIALGIGTLSCAFSGNFMNTLSLLLTLSPKAAGTALHAGLKNYLVLLNKRDIYIRNINTIEKIAAADHVVFDSKGSLSDPETGNLRTDAVELINRLKEAGITKLSLITEDSEEQAQETARKLGIHDVYSNCGNGDKERWVNEFKKIGTVLMVGNGINDIEAMRTADASVSFINFSCDRIKLQSDCIILHDDLVKLSDLITLTRKAYGCIKQNVSFAKGYNIFWGIAAGTGSINTFAAKSINTLNSITVMLLNKRIEYLGESGFGENVRLNNSKYDFFHV